MKDEIVSKLELLSEYVKNLRSYKKYSVEEIKNDFTIRGALERYLELSLECSIDIAEMIISYENLKRPDSYREVILTLGRAGIMPEDLHKNSRMQQALEMFLSTCMRKSILMRYISI